MGSKFGPEREGIPDGGGAGLQESWNGSEARLNRWQSLLEILGVADHQLKDSPNGGITALLRIGPMTLEITSVQQFRAEQ